MAKVTPGQAAKAKSAAPKSEAKPAKEAKAAKEPKAIKEKPELSGNMLESLKALKAGKAMTHDAIAKITGKTKGNRLRELTEKEFVVTSEQEGVRGLVYTITTKGKEALAKAK